MTNHLLRQIAPLTDDDWALLDAEATQRLTVALAARRLVDLEGPHGWQHSSTNLGRTTGTVAAPLDGVTGRLRRVLPLAELRADFTLSRDELLDGSRGADDVDLTALDEAAHRIASVENHMVFHGWEAAGVIGITQATPHPPLVHDGDNARFAELTATAVSTLKASGIGGPYALAAGPEFWVDVLESNDDGGYPLLRHLAEILGDGAVEWTPGITGAIVLSTRGGDFALDLGEDLSLGYTTHDIETVSLYLEESLSFRVNTPEAAVAIVPAG